MGTAKGNRCGYVFPVYDQDFLHKQLNWACFDPKAPSSACVAASRVIYVMTGRRHYLPRTGFCQGYALVQWIYDTLRICVQPVIERRSVEESVVEIT
jgi:hypothetical protein